MMYAVQYVEDDETTPNAALSWYNIIVADNPLESL